MCRWMLSILLILYCVYGYSVEYVGRVIDKKGDPILYATVYVMQDPMIGTATNAEGYFTLTTNINDTSMVVISYVGYEKTFVKLSSLQAQEKDVHTICLREQPIALEEMVVQAPKTKMSKRKRMAKLLHDVYERIEATEPIFPIAYRVVSDVKMDAKDLPWGMEQMIANVVEWGDKLSKERYVQFRGEYCKRYCDAMVREKIDTLLNKEKDLKFRNMAAAIDSGTLVHRALWEMRLQKDRLLDTSNELRKWTLGTEGDTNFVLTYQRQHNFIGILKAHIVENLIIDSYDYTLRSYTMDLNIQLVLPFSHRLRGTELDWLNLLNMSNESLDKFRLKRGKMHIKLATIYKMYDGINVPIEKNLEATALLEDRKGQQLPCAVKATQFVTNIQTVGVIPFGNFNQKEQVKRELVPIY